MKKKEDNVGKNEKKNTYKKNYSTSVSVLKY
jgi:hypothetical protein